MPVSTRGPRESPRTGICPAGRSITAAAASVATRPRSATTRPPPSGCTRFERKTTNVRLDGSSQIDVPVKPVWPNEPTGNRSPRFAE